MIGKTISHYRVIEKIGEGGMGVVYLAEHTLLGRRVAIKTLIVSGSENQHFRSRFLREAQAVSKLSHPNIANIYDYGETDDGQPYIVMELVEGKTLNEVMRAETLTIARAIDVVTQVAQALSEAHRHGIVHRDIKPSNIAINERGVVKVLDFGLAKHAPSAAAESTPSSAVHTQTREGVIVGTPLYLSPEQALGLEVDARSDLFSLGSVLYECIAGRPPFTGKSDIDICAKVIHVDPPTPSQFNNNVSPDLDHISLKALSKKPEARFQTAAEMIASLETAVGAIDRRDSNQTVTRQVNSGSRGRSTSALETLSDIFKRPRLSMGYLAAGIVIISMLSLAAYILLRSRSHRPPAEAQRLYDIGTEAIRNGSFFQAVNALQLAIQKDPQFALAHAREAEALIELDNVDKAKDELLTVAELTANRSSTASIDALYLDAIKATTRRDFPKAVEYYSEIARQLSSEPYAYVDLGRAYEKNEQATQAIDQYTIASKKDPLYATAFLRAGVLYNRIGKPDLAIESFKKAEELFQAQGKIEGRTEVLFQRGVMFDKVGRISDARNQLHQALDLASANGNTYQQLQAMLQLSSVAVSAGDIPEAQKSAQAAVDLAASKNLDNVAAGGLIDLGIVFLAHGEYAAAGDSFKQGLALAKVSLGRSNQARASGMLASLSLQLRNPEEAERYAEDALVFYRQGNYATETSQNITIIGRAHRLRGDYDGALEIFEQELKSAEQASDQSVAATIHSEIGGALEQQERYPEALSHYQKRYELSDANDEKGKSNSLTNSAAMLWRLGDSNNALLDFKQARDLADKPNGGFKQVLAYIHQSQGEMHLSEQNYREAIRESGEALSLAADRYVDVIIRAKRVMGLASALRGKKSDGKVLCEESRDLALKLKDPRLISTSLLFLAEVSLLNGDSESAMNAAQQALDTFTRAKQLESAWRASLIAARAMHKAGNESKANEYALRARDSFAMLQQSWGQDLFKSYANRRDIQFYHMQLLNEFPVVK